MKPLGSVWTARATLFNSKLEIIGWCMDTPNALAKAMQETDAAFAYSAAMSEVYSYADMQSRMEDWNTAPTNLEQPEKILRWINLILADTFNQAEYYIPFDDSKILITFKVKAAIKIIKGLQELTAAIREKNLPVLERLLWIGNQNYRSIFSEETGIALGLTNETMRKALRRWK